MSKEVKYTVDITELITNDNKEILKESFNVTDSELNMTITKIAKTAFEEYMKMLSEQGVPSRSADLKEHRLYLFLANYYVECIPTETEIAKIFHITQSQARTLLKNTMSKYRLHLKQHLKQSIKASLNTNYLKENDIHKFIISSEYIKDQVNEVIKDKKPELSKLISVQNKSGEYYCNNDTYTFLKREYDL